MTTHDHADHYHECRGCGGSVPCWTPNDECDDHPGDCADCMKAELEWTLRGDPALDDVTYPEEPNRPLTADEATALFRAVDEARANEATR